MENEVTKMIRNCEHDIYLLEKFADNQSEINNFLAKCLNSVRKSNRSIKRALRTHGICFAMFGVFGAVLAYNDICHDKEIRKLKTEIRELKTEKGE